MGPRLMLGKQPAVRRCIKHVFRGLRPEACNAGSRGDLPHILLEVLETLMQFRSAHARARLSLLQKLDLLKKREREIYIYIYISIYMYVL